VLWPSVARAQPAEPFEVTDNSFFVEEAFNQEAGIFQNIFGWVRHRGGSWESAFTQEWPVPAMTHQLSYTVPFVGGDVKGRFGHVLVNYRYQALKEDKGRPAFAPRVSAILPTGSDDEEGADTGWQINLPFSKQSGDLYFHWNAGVTWLRGVPLDAGTSVQLTIPQVAGSVVWRTTPLFHLMLESVLAFEQAVEGSLTLRRKVLTLSPGFRRGWNIGEQQLVIGAAAPVIKGEGDDIAFAGLLYFSYELPFRRSK